MKQRVKLFEKGRKWIVFSTWYASYEIILPPNAGARYCNITVIVPLTMWIFEQIKAVKVLSAAFRIDFIVKFNLTFLHAGLFTKNYITQMMQTNSCRLNIGCHLFRWINFYHLSYHDFYEYKIFLCKYAELHVKTWCSDQQNCTY